MDSCEITLEQESTSSASESSVRLLILLFPAKFGALLELD